jgi:hypothetical protein
MSPVDMVFVSAVGLTFLIRASVTIRQASGDRRAGPAGSTRQGGPR